MSYAKYLYIYNTIIIPKHLPEHQYLYKTEFSIINLFPLKEAILLMQQSQWKETSQNSIIPMVMVRLSCDMVNTIYYFTKKSELIFNSLIVVPGAHRMPKKHL